MQPIKSLVCHRLRFASLGAVICLAFACPANSQTVSVSNVAEFYAAVDAANNAGGGLSILLADGTYTLTETIYVNAANITITSLSGKREDVIIQGDAMSSDARVKNLIRVSGSDFELSNVTLQKSGWHLLQIAGEDNADRPLVRNVIFRDAFEQMLKVSIDQSDYSMSSDDGIIENSRFEYTDGIGPQYYIGGIDVHGGKNWIVRGNTFVDIISPSQEVAEFAIHFWNQSADVVIEKNLIINCDRGIGLGLDGRGNIRGIVRNNMIFHENNKGPFADVGIYLVHSPGTVVIHNTVYTEHAYPRSIEYRFTETTDVLIENNLTNRPILARNGATGTVESNIVTASRDWFVDYASGDLHLSSARVGVVDSASQVSDVFDDFDGAPRIDENGNDIGADEWTGKSSLRPGPPTALRAQ